jgi:cell division protein FtsL
MVPVVLMLGSVYVHTAAVRLKGEADRLDEEKIRVESEGERLEVRVTELSGSARIRRLARDDLGMQDPSGKGLKTYESDGEDVVSGGEQSEETGGE